MSRDHFDVIILIGRPAAGKSEVIDALKKADLEHRMQEFHIGEFEEIDDFPYIWRIFEDDEILAKMGKPRKWTDDQLYFNDVFAWDFFLEKLNAEYLKRASEPAYHDRMTTIVEFARGGENAFGHALSVLDKSMLQRAAVLYIQVSYEESCRKNRRRYKPDQAGSILHHSLPDDKMENYYLLNDWDKIAGELSGHIAVEKDGETIQVPYSALPNEPEVTDSLENLTGPLKECFDRLWKLYQK